MTELNVAKQSQVVALRLLLDFGPGPLGAFRPTIRVELDQGCSASPADQ